MDIEIAREYCLSKKEATECFPFNEYALVMKVMGKMFALIDLEDANSIMLKCDPERTIELRERFTSITTAPYFNKKYWNNVSFDGDVNEALIKELIDHSYEEVIQKFTRKLRAEYDAIP